MRVHLHGTIEVFLIKLFFGLYLPSITTIANILACLSSFHVSCLDHATRIENTLNALLYSLETHVLATLTLQMIDYSSECCKLSSAAAVRAVVELLLVNGGAEILVQGCEFAEEACAKIKLVGFSNGVPRLLGGWR